MSFIFTISGKIDAAKLSLSQTKVTATEGFETLDAAGERIVALCRADAEGFAERYPGERATVSVQAYDLQTGGPDFWSEIRLRYDVKVGARP